MITTRDDYKELLYKIQDPNRQTQVIKLPKDEPICKIDLDTRRIDIPDAVKVVEFDHNSETLYFSVDRYYDNVDLSTLFAVIQYKNANPAGDQKNGYIYAVPYFDITTLPKKFLIPFFLMNVPFLSFYSHGFVPSPPTSFPLPLLSPVSDVCTIVSIFSHIISIVGS